MKKLYVYDQKQIQFVPYKPNYKWHLIAATVLLTLGYVLGNVFQLTERALVYIQDYQTETMPIGSEVWKDSVFRYYEERAEIYISKKYPKSPIKPGMLALAAHNVYDSTGILIPVEFALAQAQIESSMGTKGRSPVNNPYNVGEYDSGTVKWFDNTYDGIEAYYFLLARDYMQCKSLDMLFKNYSNCNGHRYASNPNYEKELKQQYLYIQKYIDNRIVEMEEVQ